MFGLKRKQPDLKVEMTRRKTHRERILDLLERNGKATNVEFGRITFRYSARIGELRKDGHRITAEYVKPGVFEYIYGGKKS